MNILKIKKSYSIHKLFFRYFLILFFFTSVSLLLYCVVLIKTHFDQTAQTTNSTLNHYVSFLENELDHCAIFEQNLCYSDSSFQMLTLKNLQDSDRVKYLYNVTEMLKRQVSPYGAIFVFNENTSISTFAVGDSFSSGIFQNLYFLKEDLRDYWLSQTDHDYHHWSTFQSNGLSLLMRAEQVRGITVCTLVNLDQIDFLNTTDSEKSYTYFGFFNSEEIISGNDFLSDSGITVDTLNHPPKNQFFLDYYLVTAPVDNTEISAFCLFPADYAWSFTQALVVAFVILAVITCLVIMFIFYSFDKLLLYPLTQTNLAMKHLEQNDSSAFLANNHSNIIEYQNINEALASLMDQKIRLYNEKQIEAFEKDHAKLQFYQLQTRSHFLVNCLKSLYNMLETKEYEKMQVMISAFSNHIRYVFHDTLELVTLQEELEEVNDYYNIILLDRTTPFIMNKQVDPDLLDCRVPSLIIQTFLENTAKYNRQSDNLLIFDVKISRTELNDVPVMQIMMSDNGTGYSEEILKRLNSNESDLFSTKHVGISNLKHRVALIYKKNYQFAFYNHPSGGTCSLIFLPIDEPKDKL